MTNINEEISTFLTNNNLSETATLLNNDIYIILSDNRLKKAMNDLSNSLFDFFNPIGVIMFESQLDYFHKWTTETDMSNPKNRNETNEEAILFIMGHPTFTASNVNNMTHDEIAQSEHFLNVVQSFQNVFDYYESIGNPYCEAFSNASAKLNTIGGVLQK
jgi:hypothetical protein